MAEQNVTVQQIARAGLTLSYSAASASDNYKVPNDGRRTFLHFKKSGAGDATITITTPGTVDGLAVADRTVTVPASTGDVMVGPFPAAAYNDADGEIEFVTDEDTGLTFAALKL